MKNRNGFVSNSSTCSFWIYAMPFEGSPRVKLDVLKNKAKEDPDEYKKLTDDMCKTFSRRDDLRFLFDNIDKLNEAGEENLEEFLNDDGLEYVVSLYGLEVLNYYDGWGTFVGKSWQALDDDETPRQFRDKVDSALKELFGDGAKAVNEEGEYSC